MPVTVTPEFVGSVSGNYETNVGEPAGTSKLTVTATWQASGVLRLDSIAYPLTTSLDPENRLSVVFPRPGVIPYELGIAFEDSAIGPRIAGSIFDGISAFALVPNVALATATSAPGDLKYTALIAAPAPASLTLPAGKGWMTLVVQNNASIPINGRLATTSARANQTHSPSSPHPNTQGRR